MERRTFFKGLLASGLVLPMLSEATRSGSEQIDGLTTDLGSLNMDDPAFWQ
ncbi:MAG: hypothetical protein HOH74_13150, partial [Gemmatimonadetes bacterium]|nr:hypothetical protein [Gemmatimonadota bacterium]